MTNVDRAQLEQLSRELADKGKLIEAGWIGVRLAGIVPDGASPEQLEDMRSMFFAGAQHLFASIMTILDPNAEPTDADLARMDQIDAELENFIKELMSRAKEETA